MLVWMGQVKQARAELGRAVLDDPDGILGREAKRLLDRLGSIGTK